HLRARVVGGWIEITVEDEGIGIPDSDLERIFDRFVQGETGDRRRFGGVGIGLFIVRRLARAQNGEVTARSRPNIGTTMRLRLHPASPTPAANPPLATALTPPAPPKSPAPTPPT
ncbi:MAG: hypothetical protein JO345_03675, partial [Streptosporangiaceae bacterium]|nr:hypothetical protein [Streptosporangiaceae bacterium]